VGQRTNDYILVAITDPDPDRRHWWDVPWRRYTLSQCF